MQDTNKNITFQIVTFLESLIFTAQTAPNRSLVFEIVN